MFRPFRGKVAIYNENIRAIAERYDCIVADQWALKVVQDPRFFDPDRLHYNALGHHEVARMVLRALNVPNDLESMQPGPAAAAHLARGPVRGPRLGARAPRAVGAAAAAPSSPPATTSRPSARQPLPVMTLAPGTLMPPAADAASAVRPISPSSAHSATARPRRR